jgi:hypothetical protein
MVKVISMLINSKFSSQTPKTININTVFSVEHLTKSIQSMTNTSELNSFNRLINFIDKTKKTIKSHI